ncbi:MAG: hypothetical protein SFV55_17460 [Haliscomenobacter sp.]|uniref:hypothetical protein n=1 Tax=Haliscomenobacter sp. TaxID=2717303 RepID=UPI0029A8B6BE|nr:hypothetical protein [Haliscomenobacter sp.]MDX2070219.1 hypothetical protein [Haliscomenobacter sp.]
MSDSKAIIRLCYPILIERFNHKTLLIKLHEVQFDIAPATLTNIKKVIIEGNPERKISLSKELLKEAAKAFILVIELNWPLKYDPATHEFIKLENTDSEPENTSNQAHGIIIYQDGRRSTSEKIQFIKNAKKEIIEVGIRLHTFSQYFTSRRKSEFRDHIEQLLKKGVNMKCLMMDPASEMTRLYFMDRAKALPKEAKAYEQMPQILDDLKKIKEDLNQLGHPGQFKLFTYENFPYNHYMMVDPEEDNGKLLLSSYIHGIIRADCPVMEIRKNTARVTFNTYLKSLQMILEEAKEV